MKNKPTSEHLWLQQLVGEWTYETNILPTPGNAGHSWKSSESVRAIGGFWILCESKSDEEEIGSSIMMLGFDPEKGCFTGSFISSVLSNLWPYEGSLDEGGQKLILESVGPSMMEEGKTAKYRDTIEILDEDNRAFTSSVQGEDGQWSLFLTAHYKRTG